MASSKDLFQRNKQDVKDALVITTSPIFDKLIAFARAEMAQLNPSADQCLGANKFVEILMSLPDEQAEDVEPITSGLNHDLTVLSREPKTK